MLLSREPIVRPVCDSFNLNVTTNERRAGVASQASVIRRQEMD